MPNSESQFRVRSSQDDPVFTDSAVQYFVKTLWAKMTMPRTRIRLQGAANDILALASQLLSSAGLLALGIVETVRGAASKVKSRKADRPSPGPAVIEPRPSAPDTPTAAGGSANVIQPRSRAGDTVTPESGPPAGQTPTKGQAPTSPPKPRARARPAPGKPSGGQSRRPAAGSAGGRTKPAARPAPQPTEAPRPTPPTPRPQASRPEEAGPGRPPQDQAPAKRPDAVEPPAEESRRPAGFQATAPVERKPVGSNRPPSTPKRTPPKRPQPQVEISTTGQAQVPMGPPSQRSRKQHRPFLNEPDRVSPYGRSPAASREGLEEASADHSVVDPARSDERTSGTRPEATGKRPGLTGITRGVAALFGERMRPFRLAAIAAGLMTLVFVAPKWVGVDFGVLLDFAGSARQLATTEPTSGEAGEDAVTGDDALAEEGAASEAPTREVLQDDDDVEVATTGALAGAREWMTAQYEKVTDLLAGPLVAEGAQVVVADLEPGSDLADDLGRMVALAIEEELIQASRYIVVPRERVRAALGGHGDGLNLSRAQALAFAGANEAAAIVTGEITEGADGGLVVALDVLGPAGESVYEVEVRTQETELMASLGPGIERIRRRLGESRDEIEAGTRAAALMGGSMEAIRDYTQARVALFNGHYNAAIRAAAEATQKDTSFALAYRILGDAYALKGQRRRARQVLDQSWDFRARLSERERLRLNADRTALAGDHQEAIIAYERLFTRYRQDVLALKSQAILKEILGTRGGGLGNLELARSLDSTDWPPLSRVARYFGYRGDLPNLD